MNSETVKKIDSCDILEFDYSHLDANISRELIGLDLEEDQNFSLCEVLSFHWHTKFCQISISYITG